MSIVNSPFQRHPKIYLCLPISTSPDGGRALADAEIARIRIAFPNAEIYDPTTSQVDHWCGCHPGEKKDFFCAGCGETLKAESHVDYRRTILRCLRILAKSDIIWVAGCFGESLGCLIEIQFWYHAQGGEHNVFPRPKPDSPGSFWLSGSLFMDSPALSLETLLGNTWWNLRLRDSTLDRDPIEHDDETIAQQDAANSAPTDIEKE